MSVGLKIQRNDQKIQTYLPISNKINTKEITLKEELAQVKAYQNPWFQKSSLYNARFNGLELKN